MWLLLAIDNFAMTRVSLIFIYVLDVIVHYFPSTSDQLFLISYLSLSGLASMPNPIVFLFRTSPGLPYSNITLLIMPMFLLYYSTTSLSLVLLG